MKDRTILWLTFGGVAFWLLIGYAPSRTAVVRAARTIMSEIEAKL